MLASQEIFFLFCLIVKGENQNTRVRARVSGYPITNDDCYVAPKYQRSEVRGQRSDLVGQAFLPAEANRWQAGALALQLFPLRSGGATSPSRWERRTR